ncbi:hypothetical protein [Burkholderia cepacia]|uniref:hypothetical protein n=1 Tax=Burkholderia cepacia TaxID=292 RepID=UPI001CF15565|nr:hypothetical protein [Burkholderia cepacia]MCA8351459.1 hypothetical protein [Burkholderia cepacia]
MEEQYFIANLAFGMSLALKMVVATDRQDAIQTIYDNYEHANILGLLSLDELDEIAQTVDEGSTYFVTEVHKDGDRLITKSITEKGVSFEQLKIKYENRDAAIMDCDQMKTMIHEIYQWLQREGTNQAPLLSNRLH